MASPGDPHHDHSYKQLFSHRELVRDLLTGFVREEWVRQADLGSLETVKGITLPDINDFNEVHTVLQERVEQWNQQLVEKGRLMGRLEGESRVLARLLARRFGALPGWVEDRLSSASEAELEAWADAVLEADSLEAVLAVPPASH